MSNVTLVPFSPVVPSSMFMLSCFFSPNLCFCAVCAFHCPCRLVDLYLFIVICVVKSIVAAVLKFISMFHLTSNLMSSFAFDVGLDLPVLLDHCLRLSLYMTYHVIDHLRANIFSSFSFLDVKVFAARTDEGCGVHKWPLAVDVFTSCVPRLHTLSSFNIVTWIPNHTFAHAPHAYMSKRWDGQLS